MTLVNPSAILVHIGAETTKGDRMITTFTLVKATHIVSEINRGYGSKGFEAWLDKWEYIVKPDANDPQLATIEVYDETGEFVALWGE